MFSGQLVSYNHIKGAGVGGGGGSEVDFHFLLFLIEANASYQ